MQIVLKQLYSDKQENSDSVMQTKFNSGVKQLQKDNNKQSLFSNSGEGFFFFFR